MDPGDMKYLWVTHLGVRLVEVRNEQWYIIIFFIGIYIIIFYNKLGPNLKGFQFVYKWTKVITFSVKVSMELDRPNS